jgi:hypothetical protein
MHLYVQNGWRQGIYFGGHSLPYSDLYFLIFSTKPGQWYLLIILWYTNNSPNMEVIGLITAVAGLIDLLRKTTSLARTFTQPVFFFFEENNRAYGSAWIDREDPPGHLEPPQILKHTPLALSSFGYNFSGSEGRIGRAEWSTWNPDCTYQWKIKITQARQTIAIWTWRQDQETPREAG